MFKMEERGFPTDPSKMRALGEMGKPLSRVTRGNGRESTTVLSCIAADGTTIPPLIVFKGSAVQERWTSEEGFPGTLYAASKNGWVEEAIVYNWMTDAFIPLVKKLRMDCSLPDQAALLLFNSHASHHSLRIVEEAISNNIILKCAYKCVSILPPTRVSVSREDGAHAEVCFSKTGASP